MELSRNHTYPTEVSFLTCRPELVRRVVEDARPVAHVVKELNVSRATGCNWWHRYH